MDALAHELVPLPKKFRRHNYDRSRAVPYRLVLLVRELDQDLGRWVLDFEEGEDRRSVVGDCDIADIVNKHLRKIEARAICTMLLEKRDIAFQS